MTAPVLALAAAAVLLLIAALLRAGGASLVRTPRADALHDAAEGNRRAEIVARLLDDRPRLQPSLGIVHSGLLVLSAVPASWAATRRLSGWDLALTLVVLGAGIVLLGDFVPRTLGRRRPRTLAYRFARLLSLAVALGEAAADLVTDEEDEDPPHADETHEAEELELISSVLEFTDTIVREVMVPRPDMVTIGAIKYTDEALDLVIEAGRSRIPVTGDGMDDIVGVLYARDLLRLLDEEAGPKSCRQVMRGAYFIPETKRVSELLREMQANQVHLAIVVDEFGGTAGLVTIEDLLEEIVGEIADEYDEEAPMVTALDGGDYLIDARLGVEELGQLLGAELPAQEWDTVGGLVLSLAGRVPLEGESFEYESHRITAERVQGRRVAQVRVSARS